MDHITTTYPANWASLSCEERNPRLFQDKWFIRGGVYVGRRVNYIIKRFKEERGEWDELVISAIQDHAGVAEQILARVPAAQIKQWQQDFDQMGEDKKTLVKERQALNDEYANDFKAGDEVVVWERNSAKICTIVNIDPKPKLYAGRHGTNLVMRMARVLDLYPGHDLFPPRPETMQFFEYENVNAGKKPSVLIEHRIPGKEYRRVDAALKLTDRNMRINVLGKARARRLMVVLLSAEEVPRLRMRGRVLPKDILRLMYSTLR